MGAQSQGGPSPSWGAAPMGAGATAGASPMGADPFASMGKPLSMRQTPAGGAGADPFGSNIAALSGAAHALG